ncbi:LemA protein [Bathymodiolus thermophilus thioautotrophic gill symbiont]|uniref:LemA family protein n=1 Tax=Bathymodiolus thermophilus thioautotrophic gill symbiont TaxID=2360 RepID=A0A1J5U8E0_9GAMM|nr:LemA family protein [Bathymodiolus thermophilus thioautotrophic gill symbiont]AYQ57123.1 LemA family protein [Bathymodiolus thermophilus thioautotrophic gill symbiont]OIR24649.1 LemA family protein [Bathymodiolus thermophilus thioautotrophic gill symbiont]CAB5496473.1 LemA protein [Bathymodiolus thermophilus thioautotrophic gill symbiont]CAB5497957.1 LemA protein [Bathymodiolus thermophilus thioautotrophic gill symbiont]SGZ71359.1 LemA protein [Bathymodiolus thermophilus thioautotrophic gil
MDFIIQNWLLITIVGILVIWVVKIYNNLVSYKTQYQNGFEQISVQLKRRLDLIGNLVDAAKKYMEHEKETLMAVTQARSGLLQATQAAENNPTDANAMATLASSQVALEGAMGGFNLKMEDYPELKASENMMQLSEELTSTENRIASARQGYNDLVQKFNEYKKSFPNVVLAGMFGFGADAQNLEFNESVQELNEAPKDLFK